MFNKRQEKKRMESILDAHAPRIEAYEKKDNVPTWSGEEKKRKRVLLGSLGGALLTSGICAAVIIASTARVSFHPSYQVVSPSARETSAIVSSGYVTISEKTEAIYRSFCTQMAPYVFQDYAQSRSFSAVDAFVNLCLIGYASSDTIASAVVSGLGATSREDLKTAAKEIILALGSPGKEYRGTEAGGFALQSIWLSEALPLSEDLGGIKADLADAFYCSVFHHQPTTGEVNKYYASETPEAFAETPSTEIPQGIESASISAFYLIDKYDSTTSKDYEDEYHSNSHYLDYHLDGATKKVNYIETKGYKEQLYINDHFIGADAQISSCSFAYFLPDEGYSPKDIASDVFKENYTMKSYKDTETYTVNVKAPYFTIDNNAIDLIPAYKSAGFDVFDHQIGLFGRLLKNEGDQFAVGASQSSIMNYDYNGLYSASRTLFAGAGAMEPIEQVYNLVLDRPYVFRVDSRSLYVGTSKEAKRLPMIYGQIYDPAYAGR
jgi:hypothetical protein